MPEKIPDLDIYRSAKLLIDEHGEDAAIRSAKQADAMLEKGDMDDKRAWVRIIAAVVELQRTKPEPGEEAGQTCPLAVRG